MASSYSSYDSYQGLTDKRDKCRLTLYMGKIESLVFQRADGDRSRRQQVVADMMIVYTAGGYQNDSSDLDSLTANYIFILRMLGVSREELEERLNSFFWPIRLEGYT